MSALSHSASLQRSVLSLPARPALRPAIVESLISSEDLLKGQREILIQHGDSIYRLRHTSNDKLILTK